MTHVAHPYGLRIGIIRDWKSRWFGVNKNQYRDRLKIDTLTREFLEKRLRGYYVESIEIDHTEKDMKLVIKTSRPGMVIGRNGEESEKILEELKKYLKRNLRKLKVENVPNIKLDVVEVRAPESHAAIAAYMVVEGLEKRIPHKRVMKQVIEKIMSNKDVVGARIRVSGRLGGADMARKEEIRRGRVPLQTLRADIDYAHKEAMIPQGVLGVKVWIYKGDVFDKKNKN